MIRSDLAPWIDRANCRGCNPDLFHPRRGDGHTVAQALAVCEQCPVQAQCLLDKMTPHQRTEGITEDWTIGIAGNTTGRQRRKMGRSPHTLAMLRLRAQLEAQADAS